MIKFFNNDIYSEPGSRYKTLYAPVVNDDGTIELKESGIVDLQEEINSYAESCSLENYIARFVNGDLTALSKQYPIYGDFTKLPQSYAEYLQKRIDAERFFKSLPIPVKEKFNNDIDQFLATAGDEEWIKNFSVLKEQEIKEKDSEAVNES